MNLKVKAHAKINLFLDITGTLPNGYHSLFTVMQAIDLHDVVEVEVSQGSGISVSCNVPEVPCNERNIAYRAAELFLRESGNSAAVNIAITKNIPLEAGLGGSSTDGAAVLTALNRVFGEPFGVDRLCALGASLGADVPFCIRGGTALCTGIGDKMTPLECPRGYFIALVKPNFSCNTGDAYRAYDKNPVPAYDRGEAFAELLPRGAEAWSREVYNVFERLYANGRIAVIKGRLLKNGAIAAALTGSGSAVFGIFADERAAQRAVSDIEAPFKCVTQPV